MMSAMDLQKIDASLEKLASMVEREELLHTIVPETSHGVSLGSVLPKMKELERYWTQVDENKIDHGDGRIATATLFKTDDGMVIREFVTWAPSRDRPIVVRELTYSKTDKTRLRHEEPRGQRRADHYRSD